ncbi:LysE family transporter [Myxococcota bacterium]|nr:LysE family transporter [Myxococcota bacterium]
MDDTPVNVDLMPLPAIAAGAALGLGASIGFGPVNALCLRRTLRDGWNAGLLTGLGAVLADLIYGVVAVLGLSVFATFIESNAGMLRPLAALVIAVVGYQLFHTRVPHAEHDPSPPRHLRGFITGFLLTVSNPFPVLTMAALLATLGVSHYTAEAPLAAMMGIALGAGFWWLSLTSLIAKLRTQASPKTITQWTRWAGVALLGLAAWVLIRDLWS